jgi:hypothetical protein
LAANNSEDARGEIWVGLPSGEGRGTRHCLEFASLAAARDLGAFPHSRWVVPAAGAWHSMTNMGPLDFYCKAIGRARWSLAALGGKFNLRFHTVIRFIDQYCLPCSCLLYGGSKPHYPADIWKQ